MDFPILISPHRSSTTQMASLASILSFIVVGSGCNCLLPLSKMVGGSGTRDMCEGT